ncbi:hypothetical protein [Vibrio sp. FF145]|uniref:hypothetical protein n=1 Tax=Vibrio sp. FF145 TaxID=3230013 RepID=UPI00352CB9A3
MWFEYRNYVFLSKTNPLWEIDVYYRSQASLCEFLGINDKTLRKYAQHLRSIGWLRYINTLGTNYWFPLSPADSHNPVINAMIDAYEVWIKAGRKSYKPNMSLKVALKAPKPPASEKAINAEVKVINWRPVARFLMEEYGVEILHVDHEQSYIVIDSDLAAVISDKDRDFILDRYSALLIGLTEYNAEKVDCVEGVALPVVSVSGKATSLEAISYCLY